MTNGIGTLRDAAVARLRTMIITGAFSPRERLTESRLIELLGVSRTTVRDTVQELVHEGLLTRDPYKGARVSGLDADRIRQVAATRFPLELIGALRINEQHDEQALAALRQALDDLVDAQARTDPEDEYSAHLEFHRQIWLGAANTFLMEFWSPISHQISSHMVRIQQQTRVIDVGMHRRLLSAMERGTPYDVQAELRSHIVDSAQLLAASIDSASIDSAGTDHPAGDADPGREG